MSKMPSTGNPHRCPQCRRWFVPTVGMENISCTVMHGGSCCHFSETEVPYPNPTPPSGAQAPALPVEAIKALIDICANSPDLTKQEVAGYAESQLTALQQALADAQKDKVALLRFAGKALYENRMLSIGDWDGGDLQDTAIECGLLEPFDVEGLCGEECRCAEVGFPATCYRFTPLANEAIDAARTPDPAREEKTDG